MQCNEQMPEFRGQGELHAAWIAKKRTCSLDREFLEGQRLWKT